MATTTTSTGTVTFSNSGTAANLTQTGTESDVAGAYAFTFDVLGQSGGGKASAIYSVDDGDVDVSGVATPKGFAGYDTDLLFADKTGEQYAETSEKGAKFWIGTDNKIHYDASALAAQINVLGAGETFTDEIKYTIKLANGTLSVGTLKVVINGTNDAAVITGETSASLTEANDPLATGGTLHVTDVDGDAHFQVQNNVTGTSGFGTFSITADGSWTYRMNGAHDEFVPGQTYTDSIKVKAADGTEQLIKVTITGTNDAPSLTGTAATLAAGIEDQTYTIHASGLLSGFSDVDGGTLAVSNLSANHGALVDNNNGTWTFTPEANYNGPVTLNFTVIDGQGGHVAATQTVVVQAVNDDAVISGTATAALTETDAVLSTGGQLSVTDVDRDASLVAQTDVAGSNGYGTFSIDADGTWTYDTTSAHDDFVAGQDYTDSITVTTVDGTPQIITVTIHGSNDAPALTGTPATLSAGSEDQSYAISETQLLQGFTDVDSLGLSVEHLSADHGSIAASPGGGWLLTPEANYNGPVVLHYDVTDGFASSATTTLSMNLQPVNDDPDAVNDSGFAVVEDTPTTITAGSLLANDSFAPDTGETLTISSVQGATNGTVTLNSLGNPVFTPTANYNGPASFTYTVSDGHGGSDTATVSLSVTAVNDAPVISGGDSASYSIPENTTTVATLTASDTESDTVSWSILNGNEGARFSIDSGGHLSFVSAPDYETPTDAAPSNSYVLTVQASDGHGGLDTQIVTVNVTDVVEQVAASSPPTSSALDPTYDHDLDTASQTNNPIGQANTLVGTSSDNTINAGAGNDTVYGAAGNDSINGETHDDTLFGQQGSDTIDGGNNNDLIYGGSGNDSLTGGSGNDTILGGSGNDTISGGAGIDSITGGYGADSIDPGTGDGVADRIIYLSTADTNDTITGFVSGTDKIDLHAIDADTALINDQNFAWGGEQSGAYVLAHSVTWYNNGADVVVLADTDGVLTTAEFSITLTGITSIAQSDFDTL